ncbi:MAG: hypothetical protein ACPGWR_14585 [Ardenticatenaceae bacterium]
MFSIIRGHASVAREVAQNTEFVALEQAGEAQVLPAPEQAGEAQVLPVSEISKVGLKYAKSCFSDFAGQVSDFAG